jgi:hypothetical protein
MNRSLLSLFFFIVFAAKGNAQDSTRTGLLYGHNNAYYLTAPAGWVMDNESGKELGLTAVLYPKGSSWDTAKTVMYTTFASFDTTKQETLKQFISNDSIQFRAVSPHASIKVQKSIKMGKNKTIPVYSYNDAEKGNYDLIAYIEEKKGVVMIVISSMDKNGCINNYSSFNSLVRSYRFLTDNVNIKIGD